MMKIKSRIEKIIKSEFFLYGFFGILTTILNIGLYHILLIIGLNYAVSNFITLIVVKIAAYVVNKIFVFKSKCSSFFELVKEFFRFAITRGITMLIDFFGLIIAVEILGLDEVYSKYALQVIVIVLNYFFGKFLVFNK